MSTATSDDSQPRQLTVAAALNEALREEMEATNGYSSWVKTSPSPAASTR